MTSDRILAVLAAGLLISAPVTAVADSGDSYAAPEATTATVSNLAGFRPIRAAEWPVNEAADEDMLIRELQTAFTGGEGPPASLLLSRADGDLIIDVEQTGFKDDSLAGKRMRGVFKTDAAGLRLYEAGVQYQCARGSNTGVYTDQLCP